MAMGETATVTSRSMVNIPAKIRRKYGLRAGSKVVFVETDSGLLMIPVPPIMDLFGAERANGEKLMQAIRELEEEHRSESRT